jgi:UDP-glucuronate decarboxylase
VTGPVNLGNPNELTVGGLAKLVVEMTGTRSRIVQRPLPSDDPVRRCPDISRAWELLGWTARVPLREGLRQTIDHFQTKLAIQAP